MGAIHLPVQIGCRVVEGKHLHVSQKFRAGSTPSATRGGGLTQSLHIAGQLAAGDEQAEQRAREARLRWPGAQTLAGF